MRSTTNLLRDFLRREDGLVTVEWVALGGALVIGAITIGWLVMSNLQTPANTIGTKVNEGVNRTLPAPPG